MIKRQALVLVAHPDDGVIYFWGRIRSLMDDGFAVNIVTAVDCFDCPDTERTRRRELRHSVQKLDATGYTLGLKDAVGSLDEDTLKLRLSAINLEQHFDCIYTHGIWGDYGHRHHMDASWAAHRVFPVVRSVAGSLRATESYRLSARQWDAKRIFIRQIYESQTNAWRLATRDECFTKLTLRQARFFRAVALGDIEDAAGILRTDTTLLALAKDCLAQLETHGAPSAELRVLPRASWSTLYRQHCDSLSKAVKRLTFHSAPAG